MIVESLLIGGGLLALATHESFKLARKVMTDAQIDSGPMLKKAPAEPPDGWKLARTRVPCPLCRRNTPHWINRKRTSAICVCCGSDPSNFEDQEDL